MPVTERRRKVWSHDDIVLAFLLYLELGIKANKNVPQVIRLAELIGTTPSSVSRKLANFGSLDPELAKRGRSGLDHTSEGDRRVWNELYGRWEKIAKESVRLSSEYSATERSDSAPAEWNELLEPILGLTDPLERSAIVAVRAVQWLFRRVVLANYQSACCVCGLNVAKLLVASHIKPWRVADETERVDPQNGLCLCAIHDRAFDEGLLTFSGDLRVVIEDSILTSEQPFIRTSLSAFNGKQVHSPIRFPPRGDFLMWHRENVFSHD